MSALHQDAGVLPAGRVTGRDSFAGNGEASWEIVEFAGGEPRMLAGHSRSLVMFVGAITAVIVLSLLGRLFEPANPREAVAAIVSVAASPMAGLPVAHSVLRTSSLGY